MVTIDKFPQTDEALDMFPQTDEVKKRAVHETLGPGTVKFLFKYSKLEFMVPGPNAK